TAAAHGAAVILEDRAQDRATHGAQDATDHATHHGARRRGSNRRTAAGADKAAHQRTAARSAAARAGEVNVVDGYDAAGIARDGVTISAGGGCRTGRRADDAGLNAIGRAGTQAAGYQERQQPIADHFAPHRPSRLSNHTAGFWTKLGQL